MSPKAKTIFVCSQCGCQMPKWQGRCPDCGAWNTIEEEAPAPVALAALKGGASGGGGASARVERIGDVSADEGERHHSGLVEFDRVLGGGIVPGSVVLLSGDPGIGKSTLLLQICQTLGQSLQILYISGEESTRQIKLRANRLGVDAAGLLLSSCTDIENVIHTILDLQPQLVIVDSIQTMNLSTVTSSPGSVTQVRECTSLLTQTAKSTGIPIFLVGHVNKDGAIAGPKVLEHMVDTVLYFEGERSLSYRILRAIKNRYGSTNEIGVFQMGEEGLEEVVNPSAMLLSGRPENVSGTCVVCLLEGTRPVLAEVQALVTKTSFGVPRRTSTGFDFNRTALLIAVLEKRGGYFFGNMDAYINVVGGLRIDEPAADLAVALALVSNLLDKPLGDDVAAFGEIGLAGEVRAVGQSGQRVGEAYRLGFRRFILPAQCLKGIRTEDYPGAELVGVRTVSQAIGALCNRKNPGDKQ